MRGSADRPDSWLLCTSVACTKAEQLRVYLFLTLPLVQVKSESKSESVTAFSELLKRAQKQDSEAELLNGQHIQDTCEKGVFLQLAFRRYSQQSRTATDPKNTKA